MAEGLPENERPSEEEAEASPPAPDPGDATAASVAGSQAISTVSTASAPAQPVSWPQQWLKMLWLSLLEVSVGEWLAVLCSSALMTLAFPLRFWDLEVPVGLQGYTAWIALTPLFYVLRHCSPRKAFVLGTLSAYLYFTATIFWVVVAMVEYGQVPMGISLLALSSLTGFMALFHGAAAALAVRVYRRWNCHLAWLLAIAFTAAELARNYLFTGFPWSNPAYSQAKFLYIIQLVDLTGVYGLTFLIVLISAAVAGSMHRLRQGLAPERRELLPALGLVALALLYGLVRIPMIEVAEHGGQPLRVAMLQGNIPQDEKWLESQAGAILATYRRLADSAREQGAELIVWPEASVPYVVRGDAKQLDIPVFPPEGPGVPNLIGVPTYLPSRAPGEQVVLHNSALMVAANGEISAQYHKSHLVPFGEYVPLRDLLFFLGPIVQAVGEFLPGESVAPISDGRHRYGVLVCYEDIFPEIGRAMARGGMQLLINITNDAWYGPTSAQQQHLDMAVFRAIESRVTVVRAANTGISAVVDPVGRVVSQTENWVEAVLVREVRLLTARSPYVMLGDAFAYLCAVLILMLQLLPYRRAAQP